MTDKLQRLHCKTCKTEMTVTVSGSTVAAEPVFTREKVEGLLEALEFYARTSGKTQTINGPIIEYDPDAGPLRDRYEVPMCDNGETARAALEKFRSGK